MNEDEAFVRAIVDTRGDETARLVYADWLDDRSDPRGAYLRAEHEWARTGKKEKALRALAAALDPVWVARVSRPPVGVCADRIAMRTGRPPLAPADLDAVEARLKVALPAEYRALLLNWNGARPAVNRPRQPAPPYPYGVTEVERFLHVVPAGQKRRTNYTEDWDVTEAADVLCDPEYLFRYGRTANPMGDYIPLAQGGDGDFYLIGVRGKAMGKVAFFHDFTHNAGDPAHLGVVAPSLGAFFASIIEETPEWYRHASNGDTAALLAWLDAGGDVNAHDADRGESVLYVAANRQNLAMVRELLARGAKVDSFTGVLAGYLTGQIGQKIRAALAAAAPKKAKKPAPKQGKKK